MTPAEVAFWAICVIAVIAAVVLYLAFKKKQRLPFELSKNIYQPLYEELNTIRESLFQFYPVSIKYIISNHFFEEIKNNGQINYLPHHLQNKLKKFYTRLEKYEEARFELNKGLHAAISEELRLKVPTSDEKYQEKFNRLRNVFNDKFISLIDGKNNQTAINDFVSGVNEAFRSPIVSFEEMQKIISTRNKKIEEFRHKTSSLLLTVEAILKNITQERIDDASWPIRVEQVGIMLNVILMIVAVGSILFSYYNLQNAQETLKSAQALDVNRQKFDQRLFDSLPPYYPDLRISLVYKRANILDSYNLTYIPEGGEYPHPQPIHLQISNLGKTSTPLNLTIDSNVLYFYEDFQGTNEIKGLETTTRTLMARYKGCIAPLDKEDCSYEKIPKGVQTAALHIDCRNCEVEERNLEMSLKFCIVGRDINCNDFEEANELYIK